MSSYYGADDNHGVTKITLCWTSFDVDQDIVIVDKALYCVEIKAHCWGAWCHFDGLPIMQEMFVYKNPNNTYTVYMDEEEEPRGHFGF